MIKSLTARLILRALADGPKTLTEIAAVIDTSPVTVVGRLGDLRRNGYITSTRHPQDGRTILYSLPASKSITEAQ
jgi:DNA-binding MarR family transcriptional regulator